MKSKLASHYLGGRLQEMADQSFVKDGRWWLREGYPLIRAIDDLFNRELRDFLEKDSENDSQKNPKPADNP